MSSTGRAGADTRNDDDFYVTPRWCVEELLARVPLPERPEGPRVLDPGCGGGAIMEVLGSHRLEALVGIELDADRAAYAREVMADLQDRQAMKIAVHTADFLTAYPTLGEFDVAVMNPAYSQAQEFIATALAVCAPRGRWAPDGWVAALVRLGFLASGKRSGWWPLHPADLYVLSDRPSFCSVFTCGRKGEAHYLRIIRGAEEKRWECPGCGKPMRRTATDSADYAWAVWGPGPRGTWRVI